MAQYISRFFLSLLAIVLLAAGADASALTIFDSQIWSANEAHTVGEDIAITSAGSLTIEPGVSVATTTDTSSSGYDLLAVEFLSQGQMTISGQQDNPVIVGPLALTDPKPIIRNMPGGVLSASWLVISGSLILDSGSTFIVNPTQLAAKVQSGNVFLAGELVLQGVSATEPGASYVLVSPQTGNPVSGTFAGLPEGARFEAGGVYWLITYQGGAYGTDVIVTREGMQTLALAPDPLNMPTNSAAEMTVSLGNPAAAGGEVVSLTVSGVQLTVPGIVTVPAGSTSASFSVVSGSAAGSGTVTATTGTISKSAVVNIAAPTIQLPCGERTKDAVNAAMSYAQESRAVKRSCKTAGNACDEALADLAVAFAILSTAHVNVVTDCGGGGQ